MLEENSNSQPLGICQRLFNFFMNSLFARGLIKRLSTGHSLPDHESNEVHVEGSSTNYSKLSLKPASHTGEKSVLHADWERPKDYLSSEIMVEFRHANGVEQWSPARDFGSLDRVPMKNSPLVIGENNRNGVKEIFRAEQSSHERELNFQVQKMEKIEKKYAKIPSDQKLKGALVVEPEDNKPLGRPLLLNNINEKSDAFIRQKREALRRSTSEHS